MARTGKLRTSGNRARPLFFVTLESGCFVPLSHRLNPDGYFRKMWHDGLEMFHRFIYRAHFGDIPLGYEIDHLCNMRPCCNPAHLRAVEKIEHVTASNRTRRLGVGHPLKN